MTELTLALNVFSTLLVAFSLIGGARMLRAQRLRIEELERKVFPPLPPLTAAETKAYLSGLFGRDVQ